MSLFALALSAGLLLTLLVGAQMCYTFGDAEGPGPLADPRTEDE